MTSPSNLLYLKDRKVNKLINLTFDQSFGPFHLYVERREPITIKAPKIPVLLIHPHQFLPTYSTYLTLL